MPLPRLKITGSRGSWFATVGEQSQPVLHATWWTPPGAYRDPMEGVAHDGKRYSEYVEALRDGTTAIVQKDAAPGDLSRVGYVAVFEYSDFEVDPDRSVSLKITKRISESKN